VSGCGTTLAASSAMHAGLLKKTSSEEFKTPVPDVRIEYETRDRERGRVGLDLATGHYRRRNLTAKVRAGFSLCAHADDVSKLRRILDQRELTAEILSL
jgi:hypothetical protein